VSDGFATDEDMENGEDLKPTETLAKLYENQGFLEKAALVYRKLLRVEPNRGGLREALASIERRLGGPGGRSKSPPERKAFTEQSTPWQSVGREGENMLSEKDKPLGRLLVIHGPNLSFLGRREPAVYGTSTLEDIDDEIKKAASELGMMADTFQSNHEGEIVEKIHEALEAYDALIINPAAYTHTSVAIRDALIMLEIPIVEVHLSNVHRREPFRHKSMIADVVTGQMTGFGKHGYMLAVKAVSNIIREASQGEREV
jgi:3-dehydroquinate dehydratase-2